MSSLLSLVLLGLYPHLQVLSVHVEGWGALYRVCMIGLVEKAVDGWCSEKAVDGWWVVKTDVGWDGGGMVGCVSLSLA